MANVPNFETTLHEKMRCSQHFRPSKTEKRYGNAQNLLRCDYFGMRCFHAAQPVFYIRRTRSGSELRRAPRQWKPILFANIIMIAALFVWWKWF